MQHALPQKIFWVERIESRLKVGHLALSAWCNIVLTIPVIPWVMALMFSFPWLWWLLRIVQFLPLLRVVGTCSFFLCSRKPVITLLNQWYCTGANQCIWGNLVAFFYFFFYCFAQAYSCKHYFYTSLNGIMKVLSLCSIQFIFYHPLGFSNFGVSENYLSWSFCVWNLCFWVLFAKLLLCVILLFWVFYPLKVHCFRLTDLN